MKTEIIIALIFLVAILFVPISTCNNIPTQQEINIALNKSYESAEKYQQNPSKTTFSGMAVISRNINNNIIIYGGITNHTNIDISELPTKYYINAGPYGVTIISKIQ
jgi:hypothetical protein